jgi:hypothetical protein
MLTMGTTPSVTTVDNKSLLKEHSLEKVQFLPDG